MRSRRLALAVAVSVLLFGVPLSFSLALLQQRRNLHQDDGELRAAVDRARADVQASFRTFEYGLHGARRERLRDDASSGFVERVAKTSPQAVGAGALGLTVFVATLLFALTRAMDRRWRGRLMFKRELLAAIVERSDDAIVVVDLEGRVTSWNVGATRIFGYQAAEMLGRPLALLDPEAERSVRQARRDVDVPRRTKDGRWTTVALTETPVHDSSGKRIAWSLIMRDRTPQRRAEAALEKSVRNQRELIESLPHMVWTCEGDGPCDYLSPQWVNYTGIPEVEQLGYGWLAQLHPDDVETTKARWGTAAASGGIFDTEFRVRRDDGQYRWFKTRAVPHRNGDGRVVKWYGTNTEIQELRDAQDATFRLNRDLEARVQQRVEELRVSTASLEASTRQLQEAQRIARLGSASYSIETGAGDWSEELYRIMGCQPSLCPPPFAELEPRFPPESWSKLRTAVHHLLKSGAPCEEETVMLAPDGQRRQLLIRAQVCRDIAGGMDRVLVTVQDVTDRREVESQLRSISQRHQLATSAASIGIWDWNIEENTLTWDQTMYRLYDATPGQEQCTYETWRSRVHPEDVGSAEAAIADALAGVRDFKTSFRIVRADGTIRYVRAAAEIHNSANSGHARRMIGVNWDITEKRLAEVALRTSEALQRGILNSAGSAIIATDPHGIITLFNPAAEQLLDYREEDLVGVATPALFHDAAEMAARGRALELESGEVVNGFEVFVRRSRQGKPDVHEWTYIRRDGARIPVLLTVSTLRDENHEICGYLGLAVDLSARQSMENELRKLNTLLTERTSQAESANNAKSMFLASMSHEIRTPMNAISGVTYLLGKTELSAEQRAYLLTIERSTKNLVGMINNVLDLSKIEAQQLSLDTARCSMSTVLADLAGLMSAYAGDKPVELVIHELPGVPDNFIGDQTRLTQILTNLVGNAIKFTPRGTVRLEVRSDSASAPSGGLRFDVFDDGPGIDPQLLPKLFKPFTQGSRGSGVQTAGTGLGLAIVSQLVNLMGGQVGVESRLGEGSHFWCTIPVTFIADGTGDLPRRLTLLIVDDHPNQRHALADLAAGLGWARETAASGEEALSILSQRRFDVVIVDWKMPDSSGLELLARLREDRFEQLPCVLMATPFEIDALKGELLSQHADVFLSKPVTSSTLHDAVVKALSLRKSSCDVIVRAHLPPKMQRLAGARVLVVDDSDVNREVARGIMELEGAKVVCAVDGNDAIEQLDRTDAPPDLVLMDMQMPVLDGVGATRTIRRDPRYAALPIVALTASALDSDRQRALDSGMNDFISKPFDPEVLIACVRGQLERSLGSRPRATPSSALGPSISSWPTVDGIDIEDARARLGGNAELFAKLLRQLLPELDAFDRCLSSPFEETGVPELAHRLHKLRGATGNLGARTLCAQLREAEQRIAGEGGARSVRELIPSLKAEVDRLRGSASAIVCASSEVALKDDGSTSAPLSLEAWETFVRYLREQNLDALRLFNELLPSLARTLGTASRTDVAQALDRLDFDAALRVVECFDRRL